MSRPRAASRRRSRQAALQVLYALDLAERSEGSSADAGAQIAFDDVVASFELPEGARAFAKDLVSGVAAHLPEIDRLLAGRATNWRIERMAAVDRNVLRMAVYELLHGDAPAAVVIDEAIELARRFGGEDSPAFVNGLLDAVARDLGRAGSGEE